jgi:hypothetical protein
MKACARQQNFREKVEVTPPLSIEAQRLNDP